MSSESASPASPQPSAAQPPVITSPTPVLARLLADHESDPRTLQLGPLNELARSFTVMLSGPSRSSAVCGDTLASLSSVLDKRRGLLESLHGDYPLYYDGSQAATTSDCVSLSSRVPVLLGIFFLEADPQSSIRIEAGLRIMQIVFSCEGNHRYKQIATNEGHLIPLLANVIVQSPVDWGAVQLAGDILVSCGSQTRTVPVLLGIGSRQESALVPARVIPRLLEHLSLFINIYHAEKILYIRMRRKLLSILSQLVRQMPREDGKAELQRVFTTDSRISLKVFIEEMDSHMVSDFNVLIETLHS